MIRLRSLLHAALPLLGAACIDFVEPVPRVRTAQPPAVDVHLIAVDPGHGPLGDSLRVTGSVYRGRDADSVLLRGVDDSLRVAGRAIFPRPAPLGDDAYASYDTTLGLPGAETARRGVAVQLPALALSAVPRREVLVGFASRSGPDTLVVAEGAPIELVLRAPASDGTERYRSWTVQMRRGDANASVATSAALPDRITIPAALVPVDTASVLIVTLFENRSWGYISAADSSRMQLQASTSLNWFVRVVPR